MSPIWFTGILLLLVIYFTGTVISFNSSNKLRFELELQQNSLTSNFLSFLFIKPQLFIVVNKIGGLLSIGTLSYYLITYIHPGFSGDIITIQLRIALVIFIIAISITICYLIARLLFALDAGSILKFFLILTVFFYVLLFPLAWILTNCIRLFVYIKSDGKEIANLSFLQTNSFAGNFTDTPAKQSKNNNNKQELRILQKALVFSTVKIRDCMIPRTEIEAISINAGIDEFRRKVISTGYSKIIVYRNSIDNIVGYINAKELFKHPATIKEKLNQISFVPETMQANKLLHEFMQFHRSVAVVVDEYGGTSGLVTLEDIMEEIFGEIEDEHDTDDLVERQINQYEFILSSRLEIEYLNSTYNFKIPESEEYDTLAGYILFHHQSLPKQNAIIKINSFVFKILRVSNTRIELVHMEIKDQ